MASSKDTIAKTILLQHAFSDEHNCVENFLKKYMSFWEYAQEHPREEMDINLSMELNALILAWGGVESLKADFPKKKEYNVSHVGRHRTSPKKSIRVRGDKGDKTAPGRVQ